MAELNLEDVFKGSSSKEVNYIQYAIYLPPKESEQATHAYLRDTLDKIRSMTDPLISDYIWQKDRFHLSIAHAQDQDPPYPFLFGASRFGDCINDEWFIVYLLKHISKEIPEAVIALNDNDGDVILIEAALDLPNWLDPSNSQNRVYLHKGQVHIIPLPISPADIMRLGTGKLRRDRAMDQVRRQPQTSLASLAIQQSICERLDPYPQAAAEERHRSRCLLPLKAAFVLLAQPQLITLAIEAFYLRDPIAMKACATMSTFSPSEGMVDTIIPFTKTTYAQTISQKFYPPKPFRLPSMKEKKKFQAAELGMKVACGLEMLYHNSRSHHNQSHLSIETYDFEADKKFLAYLAQLNTLGYFKGQKEGSKLHKILTEQAKQQYLIFKRQEHPERVNQIALEDLDVDDEETFEEALSVPHPRQTIDTLLSGYSDEALERLTMNSSKESEDSDDWINVDPQQLEELLMKRIGTMNQSMMADLQNDLSSSRPGSKEAEEGIDLERMMASFENFVENSQSGVDGVEFPNDMNEFSDTDEDEEDEGAIQFDMEEFMRILKGTQGSEEDLTQVMKEMDQEVLSHQKIGGSFAKLPSKQNEDEQEEDEDAPVDVQLNLVKNVLESFKSQQGLPGPVGNMLSQFGFVLPGDTEENDE